jgi:hypothetical protein
MNHLLVEMLGQEKGDRVDPWGVERGTYMYGPGKSFIALKHRHVSSTRTGPLICDIPISFSDS